MTYSQFEKIINDLLEIKKDTENLNKAFKQWEPEFSPYFGRRYEDIIIDALKLAFNDEDNWLDYWWIERKRKFSKTPVGHFSNNKPIPFRNLKDLYNLLTK